MAEPCSKPCWPFLNSMAAWPPLWIFEVLIEGVSKGKKIFCKSSLEGSITLGKTSIQNPLALWALGDPFGFSRWWGVPSSVLFQALQAVSKWPQPARLVFQGCQGFAAFSCKIEGPPRQVFLTSTINFPMSGHTFCRYYISIFFPDLCLQSKPNFKVYFMSEIVCLFEHSLHLFCV